MGTTQGKGTGAAFKRAEQQASKRQQARSSPFERYASRPDFDWGDVSAPSLCDGVHHALAGGAALTLSLTGDGGAVKVTVWANNQKHAAYAADGDTLNELFGLLIEEYPLELDEAAD
jgi:hypothetical protein